MAETMSGDSFSTSDNKPPLERVQERYKSSYLSKQFSKTKLLTPLCIKKQKHKETHIQPPLPPNSASRYLPMFLNSLNTTNKLKKLFLHCLPRLIRIPINNM